MDTNHHPTAGGSRPTRHRWSRGRTCSYGETKAPSSYNSLTTVGKCCNQTKHRHPVFGWAQESGRPTAGLQTMDLLAPTKKAARIGGFFAVESQTGYALLRRLDQPAPRRLKPISDQTMLEAGSGMTVPYWKSAIAARM